MDNMKKIEEKTKTGWPVPVSIKESFVNFCAEKGTLAQEDCAGALFIWQYLPARIREDARLEAKGVPSVDKNFWKQFQMGLELGIQAQLKSRQRRPESK